MSKKSPVPAFIVAAVLAGVMLNAAFPSLMGQYVSPNVFSVSSDIAIAGVQRALEARSGTMIMQKDNLTMFMWTLEQGWCFIVLDSVRTEVLNNFRSVTGGGNFVNAKTMADLVTFLEKHGWEIVSASQVPTAIKLAVAAGGALSTAASMRPTMFIMPVGVGAINRQILIDTYGLIEQ